MTPEELRAARLRAWHCDPDSDLAHKWIADIDAALDAIGYEIRPKLGEDQVIVPREPTEEMLLAGRLIDADNWSIVELYESMLAAAPKVAHE